jgi:hypothetical protein
MIVHILHVVGARPNFIKAALVLAALSEIARDVPVVLPVHPRTRACSRKGCRGAASRPSRRSRISSSFDWWAAEGMKTEARAALSGGAKRGTVPPLCDRHAAERIADHITAL